MSENTSVKMRNSEDSKQLSKKLTTKVQKMKPNTKKYTKRSSIRSSTALDAFKNDKPIPSLAVLEMMYEDEEPQHLIRSADQTVANKSHQTAQPTPSRENTNVKLSPKMGPDNSTFPAIIKKIAIEMMEYIENMSDPQVLVDDGPPPPIIQPKKRNKPEEAYIVGCKDRDRIPTNTLTSVNFCKGHNDCGVDNSQDENSDEKGSETRAKRTEGTNHTKSIFNSQCDEISLKWKNHNKVEQSDDSDDSAKTVIYDSSDRPFSPKPSTSKDSGTIIENDKRFHESFISDTNINNSLENSNVKHTSCVKLENKEEIYDTIIIDDDYTPDYRTTNNPITVKNKTDNCIERIDKNHDTEIRKVCATSDDDYYSNFTDSDFVSSDNPEIIDVDNIIAENKAILNKYTEEKKFNLVTHVHSSTISKSKSALNVKSENDETVKTEPKHVINDMDLSDFFQGERKVDTQVPHEDSANDVIIIDDNYDNPREQWTDPHNTEGLPPNPYSVNNRSSVQLPKRKTTNKYRLTKHQTLTSMSARIMKSLNRLNPQHQAKQRQKRCRIVFQQTVLTPAPPAKPQPSKKSIGDCPICMESLSNTSVASTICGHIFCMACIKSSIKLNGKKCPTCRKTMRGVGYHQLFL